MDPAIACVEPVLPNFPAACFLANPRAPVALAVIGRSVAGNGKARIRPLPDTAPSVAAA
ncbi:hypothetical protein LHP98_12380 [Rhodobacter sp. Har01]|uniref:hypothetical protein n=1 Tax=Rhodobacter sp. Har01 TaxID=2883999 RepID=UPI001D08B172|nr:hypothetical protein [Rhodobacter sp. Har01]MCB6178923.1 hypothetical protein [Rhodobacter sp. Har01]